MQTGPSRRYEDVIRILESGISVISTINVQVDQALGSFFKIGNLIALRELALGYHYCMLN